MITWLHDTNNELITDDVNDLKKLGRRNTMRRRGNRVRRQMGGPGGRPQSRRGRTGRRPVSMARGGRVRRQMGGISLPKPWNRY